MSATIEHAEWCDKNLNGYRGECDCGGNGGRCPRCGADGPCGWTDDGDPLICSAASVFPPETP